MKQECKSRRCPWASRAAGGGKPGPSHTVPGSINPGTDFSPVGSLAVTGAGDSFPRGVRHHSVEEGPGERLILFSDLKQTFIQS